MSTLLSTPSIRKVVLSPNAISPTSVVTSSRPLLSLLLGEDSEGVFALCARHMTVNDDEDEEWALDPATLYPEYDTTMYAEVLVEQFLQSLGSCVLPHVLSLVDSLISTPQNQRSALAILEACLLAVPVSMIPHRQTVVETALNLASSPNVRVQYQSIQLLACLCIADPVEEEVPYSGIRQVYGARMLQCCAQLCQSKCTKVAAQSCLAIISYCRGGNGSENCPISPPKEWIVPHVGALLESFQAGPLAVDLTSNLDEGERTVLHRAIEAIACLAQASEKEFQPYYSGIMPGLKACATYGCEGVQLSSQCRNLYEVKKLRGAALEAATIVGAAVSSESIDMYAPDASEIMTIATTLLQSPTVEIIPMDQVLSACARIAAVMGERYVVFLPMVLPHILKRAGEKLDVSITVS